MNTSLLSLLSRSGVIKRARVYILNTPAYGPVPFRLECRKRAAGGYSFRLVWFPCWLLNCMWDVEAFRPGQGLRDMLAAALTRENTHYLPYDAAKGLRAILEAGNEVAA